MAKLYLEEFARAGVGRNGIALPAGEEPALATQTVSIGAGSVQSSALNSKTRVVRLAVDATCSIACGSNPTATTSNRRMAANSVEFVGVTPEAVAAGFKYAVITNT